MVICGQENKQYRGSSFPSGYDTIGLAYLLTNCQGRRTDQNIIYIYTIKGIRPGWQNVGAKTDEQIRGCFQNGRRLFRKHGNLSAKNKTQLTQCQRSKGPA